MVEHVNKHVNRHLGTTYHNEHHLETEVKRIVGRLASAAEDGPLAVSEHCRLLQDFEKLLELKVLRQRRF